MPTISKLSIYRESVHKATTTLSEINSELPDSPDGDQSFVVDGSPNPGNTKGGQDSDDEVYGNPAFVYDGESNSSDPRFAMNGNSNSSQHPKLVNNSTSNSITQQS